MVCSSFSIVVDGTDADWIVPNTFASRLVHDSGYVIF